MSLLASVTAGSFYSLNNNGIAGGRPPSGNRNTKMVKRINKNEKNADR